MYRDYIGYLAAFTFVATAGLCPAEPPDFPDGLHLSDSTTIHGTFSLQDNKGNQWDIRLYQGTLQKGTQYNLNNSPYLYVNGANFRVRSNQADKSRDGTEIEIGPWSQGKLKVWRRIRVYKKHALARWLEIFHNPTDQKVAVKVRLRTHMNFGHKRTKTVTGESSVGPKDWAFYTEQNNVNQPRVLHVICGPSSGLRPTVSFQHNFLETEYTVTIPAGQTAVLAYFLGQGSPEDLEKQMKTFQPREFFKDLPSAVRKRIVNFKLTESLLVVELDRSPTADAVTLRDGRVIRGDLRNETFALDGELGRIEVPAAKVIGGQAGPFASAGFRLVLTDGQILPGRLPDQSLRMEIPSLGTLAIPAEDVRSFSFRIGPKRPEEIRFLGPYLVTRAGGRLAFERPGPSLVLHTVGEAVELPPDSLFRVRFDLPDRPDHQVEFRNGSILTGVCEPERLEVSLRTFGRQSLPRHRIARIEYARGFDDAPSPPATLSLVNGDELKGRLSGKPISLQTPYGSLTLHPPTIRTITNPTGSRDVRMEIWNGTQLLGKIDQPWMTFQIQPGPTVRIHPVRIRRMNHSQPVPPQQIRKHVEELIRLLGSESYQNRKDAHEQLVEMGPSILPILKKHDSAPDLEIRQRVRGIIQRLEEP